jgi:hypothetical protein
MAAQLAIENALKRIAALESEVPTAAPLVSASITNPAAALAGANINIAAASAGSYLNPVGDSAAVAINPLNQAFILPAEHTYRIRLDYSLVTTGAAPVVGSINVIQYDSNGNLIATRSFPAAVASAAATGSAGSIGLDLVIGSSVNQIAFSVTSGSNITGLAAGSYLTIDQVA